MRKKLQDIMFETSYLFEILISIKKSPFVSMLLSAKTLSASATHSPQILTDLIFSFSPFNLLFLITG